MIKFLLIIAAIWLLWPLVKRLTGWLAMWLLKRTAEDYVRRAAGMPPRGKSRKDSFRQNNPEGSARRRARRRGASASGPIIPKEYAVDVEYEEYREYSSETEIKTDAATGETREWHESQVTDVEWVEISGEEKSRRQP